MLVGLAGSTRLEPTSQSLVRVTSPAQEFGARIGDDYFLATYRQLEQYWKKLDAESDRVRLVLDRPDRGGPHAVDGRRLGAGEPRAARSLPDDFASARAGRGQTTRRRARLRAEGKAVVWIDGGLHADEVLGAQQLIELVYELAPGRR